MQRNTSDYGHFYSEPIFLSPFKCFGFWFSFWEHRDTFKILKTTGHSPRRTATHRHTPNLANHFMDQCYSRSEFLVYSLISTLQQGSLRARGDIVLRRSKFSEENHVELNSEKLPEGPVGSLSLPSIPLKTQGQGHPWWSSGRESTFQCRGRGFDPQSGNQDPTCHGATKPVRATTTEPVHTRASAPQGRACIPQLRPNTAT